MLGSRQILTEAAIGSQGHDLATFPALLRNYQVAFCSSYFDPVNRVSRGREPSDALYLSRSILHGSARETFGLVVPEAMTSGIPVIARDEGGLNNAIHQGRTGYPVPPNDLRSFVQRMLELSRDVEFTHEFGDASRAQALIARWETMDAIEESGEHIE
ncbi:hypothetical protein GGR58DRAFT_507599 [Xylaria digitata]|nr:hypothetical protein GGR58DRAFT_507599 [Xylaria digitata]